MANKDQFIQAQAFDDDQPAEPAGAMDAARKQAYRERLARLLKDPEFRQIEGFPHGTDEAILALSDPPYYTACPNPFLAEILREWQAERRQLRAELDLPDEETLPAGVKSYQREPFAADVSEGKNDPIYNAHSYHTKVPHKAIMRYILHYTDPGDIVFDGFCGTGMTGVAAQLCGDRTVVEALGYYVDRKGQIFETKPTEGDTAKPFSRLGARKAVLNDLSPAATFIAYNYNTPVDARAFEKEARRILAEVEAECGWMYETGHPQQPGVKGRINYTVWSDVFRCPHCGQEQVFWDVAVDAAAGSIKDVWDCPGCGSRLAKSPRKGSGALRVERAMDTLYDRALKQTIRQARQVPVLINYSVGKKRYEKRPDEDDLALIRKIEESDIPYPFPVDRMPEGGESRRNDDAGITHVHHFYTRRNLWVLAAMMKFAINLTDSNRQIFIDGIQSITTSLVSKLTRYKYKKSGNSMLSGTLYVASTVAEQNILKIFTAKIEDILIAKKNIRNEKTLVQTNSSHITRLKNNSLDYVFVDPPFGSNLMYSELNFLPEAWLGTLTNSKKEAIVNNEQKKGLFEYQTIMQDCFLEFFRILKPGHWMTIEFHNSQNAVWISIQDALLNIGFMIADVRTLDKQQGSFKQVNSGNAVQQDLIISAYKPSIEFEKKFQLSGGTLAGAWDFVRQHLEQLPMPTAAGGSITPLGERMPYLLFDRMVAFHLVRGLTVPLSAGEFYMGLSERFLMRDSMAFTSAQAGAYDRLRLTAERVQQLALFVTDEVSAIQWLRGELEVNGPQTYSDLYNKYLQQLHQEKHEKLPELRQLLEQNFLRDSTDCWFNPDPQNQQHLQQLREQELLREFNEYKAGSGKLRVFREEAVRAGFSRAWAEHQYALIVQVGDRLPEQVLNEDPQLKLYYDNALNRVPKEQQQTLI